MTIKLIFCWMLSISFVLPLSGMNKKFSGAGDVALGTGMAMPGAIMTAYAIAGSSPIAPIAALGIGVTGCGIKIIKDGLEKICGGKKDVNLKVEGGQLLIQYKDPADGKLVYQKYSGAEVYHFLKNDGFIITWRDIFPHSKRAEEYQKVINHELKPLLVSNGKPILYGQHYQIRNDQLRQAHAQAIENPAGIDTLANELAAQKNLFAALRCLAVYSYGTPVHEDNLPLFTKAVSQTMAKLMLVTASAFTYPYEDWIRTLRAEKEAEFRAERDVRNQLQIDLNAEQADKARIQERGRLTLAQAVQQSCDIEAQRADSEDRAQRLNGALAQAVQQSCDIEEQRFDLERENATLRQQLHALQQQLTNSQKIIRKQSKDHRRTINKLHALQRAQQK